MTLLSLSMLWYLWILTKAIVMLCIYLPTTMAYVELIWVENSMKEHTCNACIVKSNLGSKESWVIQLNQDVHVCGYKCWIHMVANLILLCSLKTYLSFETWNNFARKHGLSYSFFSGEHLRTHCFRYLRHLSIFSILFFSSLFFMNNFCIAHASISTIETFQERHLQELGAFIITNLFLCLFPLQE